MTFWSMLAVAIVWSAGAVFACYWILRCGQQYAHRQYIRALRAEPLLAALRYKQDRSFLWHIYDEIGKSVESGQTRRGSLWTRTTHGAKTQRAVLRAVVDAELSRVTPEERAHLERCDQMLLGAIQSDVMWWALASLVEPLCRRVPGLAPTDDQTPVASSVKHRVLFGIRWLCDPSSWSDQRLPALELAEDMVAGDDPGGPFSKLLSTPPTGPSVIEVRGACAATHRVA